MFRDVGHLGSPLSAAATEAVANLASAETSVLDEGLFAAWATVVRGPLV
ncbi:hypothetical protein [Sabulicella rubraurantiaca]|nr:hypothetical protein [Sabulicella rubraurantiaca]